MIQRIQTVFLIIAAILLALMFAFPLAKFYSEFAIWEFNVLGVESKIPGNELPYQNNFLFSLLPILISITVLILIFDIFVYKKRQLQIKIANLAIFLVLIIIAGIFFVYVPLIEKQTQITADYLSSISIFLPLISLIFIFLAIRFIKKDEKMIKSTERLR